MSIRAARVFSIGVGGPDAVLRWVREVRPAPGFPRFASGESDRSIGVSSRRWAFRTQRAGHVSRGGAFLSVASRDAPPIGEPLE